ncbi:MAG: hypothetical protein ACYTG0_44240 [Planctomycetota bacterium]
MSTFAPAADLVGQVSDYLEDFEEAVESEDEFENSKENLPKYANTMILIALALGLHDSDNEYQAAAPAMVKAAQEVAAAADFASAKAAVDAFKEALKSTDGDPASLKWEKVASLPELMKAVPLISNRLKRYTRNEDRMKGAVDLMAGNAAVLAVIAQGSLPNSDETDEPEEVQKWIELSIDMRDESAKVIAAIRAFEKDPTTEAFDAAKTAIETDLEHTCTACHEIFKPDQVSE